MISQIVSILKTKKIRHYIRKVRPGNYWFDFSVSKMEKFIDNFGDNFCLVLYASQEYDNAYIIPYSKAKEVFTEELIDRPKRRWTGTIKDDRMGVFCHPSEPKHLRVKDYYNAFNLLEDIERQ